jgi:hypothetical protein
MPRSRAIVTVDEQLSWLVELPEAPAGAARPASPAGLALPGARPDTLEHAAVLAGAVTAALMEWLRELPELPFIGEPFGGNERTD